MNYRLLLQEMFIDYKERCDREKSVIKKEVYQEVIRDLTIALDIEVGMIKTEQDFKKILNEQ